MYNKPSSNNTAFLTDITKAGSYSRAFITVDNFVCGVGTSYDYIDSAFPSYVLQMDVVVARRN